MQSTNSSYKSMTQKPTRLQAHKQQIKHLQQRLFNLQRTSNRYSWFRLGTFLTGLLISGGVLYLAGLWLFFITLFLWLLLFGITVYIHHRIEQSIAKHQALHHLKSTQIARANLDWSNIPLASGSTANYNHPFEADLDLVGQYSLQRLIDTAVSLEGSQRLRMWLTASTPPLDQISRRQQLVRELTPLFLFRDKLILNATLAAGTRKIWDANRLTIWLQNYQVTPSLHIWLIGSSLFITLNIILLGLNGLGFIPAVWQFTFVLYFGLLLFKSTTITAKFQEAIKLQDTLKQLSAIFHSLESFSYAFTPHLKTHCAPFLDKQHRPSQYLRRIIGVVFGAGLRSNPIVWIILNAFFPWDIYFALRLNQYTAGMTQHVPHWMEVWFELEALSSLANLAYLNPAYTLPTILQLEQNQAAVFKAQNLGHPLIPDDERVNNNFEITHLGQVKIITGSNMAGKSTFLRTVGTNLALAFAGGPVNALHFETWPFRLFTCIKVSDSVTDGISYFYAEVKCLKTLLAALEDKHPRPLFFFIDEIFRGTNNRERLIGSRAYLQALVSKHGVGLISTHDLELATLSDKMMEIENYHFKDAVVDDYMVFDYAIHPGPCPTTNALKIMQMEGLPITTHTENK